MKTIFSFQICRKFLFSVVTDHNTALFIVYSTGLIEWKNRALYAGWELPPMSKILHSVHWSRTRHLCAYHGMVTREHRPPSTVIKGWCKAWSASVPRSSSVTAVIPSGCRRYSRTERSVTQAAADVEVVLADAVAKVVVHRTYVAESTAGRRRGAGCERPTGLVSGTERIVFSRSTTLAIRTSVLAPHSRVTDTAVGTDLVATAFGVCRAFLVLKL